MRDESIHRVPRARFHSFCNHLVGFRNDAGWTKTHGRYLPDETTDIVRKLQAQARQQFVRGYLCALTHAGLADKATAIDFLKREYLNHDDIDTTGILVDPMFDPLRGDLRLETLVDKTPEAIQYSASRLEPNNADFDFEANELEAKANV